MCETKFLEHPPQNWCPFYVLYKIPLTQANFLLAQLKMLPDSTKPLPEPTLTYYQLGPVTFMWGHYHKKIWRYQSVKQDLTLHF